MSIALVDFDSNASQLVNLLAGWYLFVITLSLSVSNIDEWSDAEPKPSFIFT